jgi:hypothetical protein
VIRLAVVALLLAACAPTLVVPPNPSLSPAATAQAARTDQAGNVLEPTTDPAMWATLEARPLRLPSVDPGAPCPVSPSATIPGSATAAAHGEGPLFAVTGGDAIGLGQDRADGLRPGKVMWIARPDYRGVALIRAARLDGPSDILFTAGRKGLRFDLDTRTTAGDATTGSVLGWRYLPSNVLVAGSGCYGFQIDMPDRTEFVTLAAKVYIP